MNEKIIRNEIHYLSVVKDRHVNPNEWCHSEWHWLIVFNAYGRRKLFFKKKTRGFFSLRWLFRNIFCIIRHLELCRITKWSYSILTRILLVSPIRKQFEKFLVEVHQNCLEHVANTKQTSYKHKLNFLLTNQIKTFGHLCLLDQIWIYDRFYSLLLNNSVVLNTLFYYNKIWWSPWKWNTEAIRW